uniref:Uncharacterized protein n=1 Tax=Arundo donax TaxID=35708 RepID=A0A0A9BXS1_ARUDO
MLVPTVLCFGTEMLCHGGPKCECMSMDHEPWVAASSYEAKARKELVS